MTEVNIAALEAQHGKIKTVIIPLDEDKAETLTIYCKAPTRAVRKMISELTDKNTDSAIIAGFNALRVAGDELIKLKDSDYGMTSAEDALITLLQVQKAEIKKN